MSRPNDWLLKHRKSVTSQFGEDGVIEKIFQIIPARDKWCVEFGAGNGKTNSNTWNLISKGWNAVLIEADERRNEEAQQEHSDRKGQVYHIQEFVNFTGKNSLDSLLKKTPLPLDFSFLSIDIDGNDYHVWDSLKKYKPKVVIIEFNCSFPPDIEYAQERDMSVRKGSSLLSFNKLGKKKGYELVYAQDGNAIFVLRKYYKLFGIQDNSLDALYTDRKSETRIVQHFDGTLALYGRNYLLWHGLEITDRQIQVLPRWLRGFDSTWRTFVILGLRACRIYKPYLPLSTLFNRKKISSVMQNLTVTKLKK